MLHQQLENSTDETDLDDTRVHDTQQVAQRRDAAILDQLLNLGGVTARRRVADRPCSLALDLQFAIAQQVHNRVDAAALNDSRDLLTGWCCALTRMLYSADSALQLMIAWVCSSVPVTMLPTVRRAGTSTVSFSYDSSSTRRRQMLAWITAYTALGL